MPDYGEMPLQELMRHIVLEHHDYLRLRFPAVEQQLRGLDRNTGFATLFPVFQRLQDHIAALMDREEDFLFPAVRRAEESMRSGSPLSSESRRSLRDALDGVTIEQDRIVHTLDQIRDLLGESQDEAVTSLREVESDLRLHLHLEKDILFPRARELSQ